MKVIKVFGGLVLILVSGLVLAQGVPQLINYQGRLTDDTGLPIDGTREMRFRMLDADTITASVLWSETHTSVQVDQGIYHVLLGSVKPLPPSAMSQADIFLEVRVAGEVLRPRSQITSVPFAHKAASVPDSVITSAMIADGTITGSDINSQTITSSNISDETITSTQIQDSSITGADIQDDSLGTDDIQDIYALNTGDTVTGSLYMYGSPYGAFGAWSGDPANNYGYIGASNSGVYGIAGHSGATGTMRGGYFESCGAESTRGVIGVTESYGDFSTAGILGYATNFSTGSAYGGYFRAFSDGEGTHYGVIGIADDYSGWFQGGPVHVGDGGTENNIDGDGDLFVENELEVGGTAYISGNLVAPGGIDSSDIATGAIMAVNIGQDCAIGEALIRTPSGWACGKPWLNSSPLPDMWTWMSGEKSFLWPYQNGYYGIKGVPDAFNRPGSRENAASWMDGSGRFWLFGGYGFGKSTEEGREGHLNDLWRWDGTEWTWMSGDTVTDSRGFYGTKGLAHPDNVPGARMNPVTFVDSSNNLWLFGGPGFDETGPGYLNDLWKWDGANWIWISGSNSGGQNGVYGIKGTPDPLNVPGGRGRAVSWTDSSGNFWLFGGHGYPASGVAGRLNDLWRWDGTNWTWMSGDTVTNQHGVYGDKGIPDPANIPGAREEAVAGIDETGNFLLFGGVGYASSGDIGYLNDLWSWDGTNWTWMSGDTVTNQNGVYGIKGTPDPRNVPGAREEAVACTDSSGNLWLFGGLGYPESGISGLLNDLWKWDGTYWTWIGGTNILDQNGIYGLIGVPDPANMPGSRMGAVSGMGPNDTLWLFGGFGWPESGPDGYLNDLWRYQP